MSALQQILSVRWDTDIKIDQAAVPGVWTAAQHQFFESGADLTAHIFGFRGPAPRYGTVAAFCMESNKALQTAITSAVYTELRALPDPDTIQKKILNLVI